MTFGSCGELPDPYVYSRAISNQSRQQPLTLSSLGTHAGSKRRSIMDLSRTCRQISVAPSSPLSTDRTLSSARPFILVDHLIAVLVVLITDSSPQITHRNHSNNPRLCVTEVLRTLHRPGAFYLRLRLRLYLRLPSMETPGIHLMTYRDFLLVSCVLAMPLCLCSIETSYSSRIHLAQPVLL
jgi:hypothetical protein